MYSVVAYQVASAINIKQSRQQLPWQLLFQDSDELYFTDANEKYIYIFQYGMVCFFNMTKREIETALQHIQPFSINYIKQKLSDSVQVVIEPNTLKVEFDQVMLPHFDEEMIRLVMLNTSQSVALNRYSEITEELLTETNKHTLYLEENGKLDISGNKLKRFIGKILNIKNKISENLYIFDSPEITWENEVLNKLNQDLKQSFDLKDRYRLIHDRIEIIKENLELFKDIMDHRESSLLEWTIIILIVIEVIDLFIAKLLNFI
ncbi:RMD1 family protein [Aestuariivivens sediminis]|uniref:RMD1 family protein n=1 Tax=Aestuariivivens sediminis TaxID=2913557 RepID=UPI001F57D63A|nr:RMD1 family protein [Aestuariivivens sediminis]